MKCIKSIRETKETPVGTIKRVDDKTANNMVGLSWVYVPKSEWKTQIRKSKPKEEVSEEKTQSEKKPYKKGQKSEIHKNKNNGKH